MNTKRFTMHCLNVEFLLLIKRNLLFLPYVKVNVNIVNSVSYSWC